MIFQFGKSKRFSEGFEDAYQSLEMGADNKELDAMQVGRENDESYCQGFRAGLLDWRSVN